MKMLILGTSGYVGMDEVVGKVVKAKDRGFVFGRDLIAAGASVHYFDEDRTYCFLKDDYYMLPEQPKEDKIEVGDIVEIDYQFVFNNLEDFYLGISLKKVLEQLCKEFEVVDCDFDTCTLRDSNIYWPKYLLKKV